MNVTRHPAAAGLATEYFDTETQELLDAIDVALPEFGDIDLDIAFGTPLELHEPAGTRREMHRYTAAIVAAPTDQRYKLSLAHGAGVKARVDAARDILAADPSIAELVRERLVDVLLPYATQLRIAPPVTATEPVPFAA